MPPTAQAPSPNNMVPSVPTSTAAPHGFLDMLPHILLLLTVLLAFFPPPFRGRGPLFVVIVTIVEWQAFAAPWPANDGDTRGSRYGLTSSWLFLLPVIERLLVHTPERDFWRIDSEDDLTQLSPQQRQRQQDNDSRKPAPPREFSLAKIWWSLALFSTPRAVGWNFGSRRLNAQRIERRKARRTREEKEESENAPVTAFPRAAFVAAKLTRAFACYLVWDAVVLAERKVVFPADMAWAWDGATLGRIAYLDFLMLVTTYVGMTMQFETVAALGVALFLSQPEDWPVLFGDIAECYTIANVWGKYWHQYIRQPCLGFSHYIIQKLHIPGRSRVAYLIHLATAFFISSFFHCVAVGAMAPGFYPLRSVILDFTIFFGLQPVGIMLESVVIDLCSRRRSARQAKKQQTMRREDGAARPGPQQQQAHEWASLLSAQRICGGDARTKRRLRVLSAMFGRTVGYVWVICWFYVTGWWFVRPYIGVGVVNWDLPYSILSKLLIPGK
ncbi:hypothetical protein B0T22DRAFT_279243 [Podospora appendiculata]|uniref:Wax synthase domain-containing protein n=1 Tax=Podospora appendiculata TaxID=314037 RepID=A0AAE0X0M0_9PEZI|nr:hypothetical protein B0T22DRAFT_279243 [Podospora appendiculata]